ncbi:MAG: rrtA [Rhizobacter sp.]|nr:rrtA [Rhizobacter sp.]
MKTLKTHQIGYLIVLTTCVLLQLGGNPVASALRYDYRGIVAGEWWRLLTAHFVHLGWAHCALNMAGIGVCLLLDSTPRTVVNQLFRFGLLAVGVSFQLLVFSPQITTYVGLSGVIYGMYVLLLVPRAQRGEWLGWVGLALVAGRVGWQLAVGSPASEEARIGGRIISQAHLYGVTTALAMCAAVRLHSARRNENKLS